ncbi:MAG: iron ABC transporter substrate-binding protein, partial [Angelakisella sp.]
MKATKRLLSIVLSLLMVVGMVACGSKPAEPVPAPAPPAAPAPAAPAPAPAAPAGEPSGTVVVYSPHDADPLNAGVNEFMKKYPGIKVEVVAAGTGELCNRIKAE